MTAITTAARLLRVAADELKNAHTLGGDWGNEHEALDAYNEHMATATTLEHMARQCLQQIEEPSGAAPAAVAPQGEWRIDTSAGRGILVYKNCSVIEAEQAPYVLGLIAADAAAAHAPALEAPAAPVTLMTEDQASRWAWDQIREEVGTKGWTTGDSSNFFGFFLHGWNYRGQYELQRPAAMARAALAAAPQAPNCTRCSGSGEDPEGYLTHGRGPDDHTVDGPCRECDGSGAAPQAPAAPVEFQQRVQPWLMECFGPVISADKQERNHRFLEEALETVQAAGCTASEAHQLVDYVFGRPVGEPAQEVGGVMVTLAALCLASGLDMHAAGETELARIWGKVEQIRAKQAAKPKHSPLPAAPAAPAVDAVTSPLAAHAAYAVIDSMGWDLDGQEKDDMLSLLRAYEKRQGIAAQAKEGGAR